MEKVSKQFQMENLKENVSECKKKLFQLTRSNKPQLKKVAAAYLKFTFFMSN